MTQIALGTIERVRPVEEGSSDCSLTHSAVRLLLAKPSLTQPVRPRGLSLCADRHAGEPQQFGDELDLPAVPQCDRVRLFFSAPAALPMFVANFFESVADPEVDAAVLLRRCVRTEVTRYGNGDISFRGPPKGSRRHRLGTRRSMRSPRPAKLSLYLVGKRRPIRKSDPRRRAVESLRLRPNRRCNSRRRRPADPRHAASGAASKRHRR